MATEKDSSKRRQKRSYKHLGRRAAMRLALAVACAGVGVLLAQPRWLLAAIARFKPGALYAVDFPAASADNPLPKIVALTIDDGPGPATANILAVLERHGAKATFFNISSHLPGYEEAVAQTVAAGHELGNHLTADEPSIRLGDEAFEADLRTAEGTWLPFVAEKAALSWLRPGMGFYNDAMVQIAERHGYRLVLGSNFPYDTHLPIPGFARAFILNTVQPGDIIVLHDGQGEHSNRGDRTAATLEKILPALQSRGYTVTTLTALVEAAKNPTADNPTAPALTR